MDIAKVFNGVFEGHEPALLMYGRRVEVLANNLANADTPNFKARDLDFAGIMADIFAPPMDMVTTDAAHLSLPTGQAELKYRIPMQASLDGNTVETSVEQAQFSENNVRYQMELNEVNGTITDLNYAITGTGK